MNTRSSRNNVIAGLFVLIAVIAGVWVSFVLAGGPDYGKVRRFSVVFDLSDGATGLKEGSPVQLGGQEIGRVERVRFELDAGGRPTGVIVAVQVRADLPLYENAVVVLERPLLGNLSAINILDAGDAAAPNATNLALVEDGELVRGGLAPPAFLAQAGLGSDQIQQIRSLVARMEQGVDQVATLIEKTGPDIEKSFRDSRELIEELRTAFNKWDEKIDRTLVNVRDASDRIDPLMTDVERGVDQAVATIESVKAAVDENRPRVDAVTSDLATLSARLRDEGYAQFSQTLDSARTALGSAQDALTRVSRVVTEETPSIRRILANARLASEQLKLTTIEVRSQPWRLLYRPSLKERETEDLYDAARSYASAASDLRAASESLEAAAAGQSAPADERLDALTADLAEAMSRFRAAETKLLDTLIKQRER